MNFRKLTSSDLAVEFKRVRELTLRTLDQFKINLGPSLKVKLIPSINAPRWEFSHVAWFSERWILRNKEINEGENANINKILHSDKSIETYLTNADELFDSSKLVHDNRWNITLPTELEVKNYLKKTLEKIILQIENEKPSTNDECYFYRLSLAHEYMHLEAFIMTAQILKFPIFNHHKKLTKTNFINSHELLIDDNATFTNNSNSEFIFDNETVKLNSHTNQFEIDSCPVNVKNLLQFYEDDGYKRKSFWSADGWKWLLHNKNNTFMNLYSTNESEEIILKNWFGLSHSLKFNCPALHVSYYEAEAYCNWKSRRLPTEFEWMIAAERKEFVWGSVWEWTNDIFKSYNKFRPHPYSDYSKPWFNDHQVVKGSSFATQKEFKNSTFRNFYQKHRNDVFIGFRTVKDLL